MCEAAKHLHIELTENVMEDILVEFVRVVRMKFHTLAKLNHSDRQMCRSVDQRLHYNHVNRRKDLNQFLRQT